ncbi:MAG: nucleotide exchange factor GrpE [Candidatus Omnitrophica bacterium]|nr:nucleotide exchange factor GrpE [Candidatus Omnitrophota bacterium]
MAEQKQEIKTMNEFPISLQPPERLLRGMDNLGALVKSVRSLGEKVDKLEGAIHRIEIEPILQDLILLGDNITRAIPHFRGDHCEESTKRFISFLELMRKEIEMILRRYGVETFDSVGGSFDPDLHKIVHTVECHSDEKDGLILEVTHLGYRFEGRVLRPAEVVVTRKQNSRRKEE